MVLGCGVEPSSANNEPPKSGTPVYGQYPGLCADLCWYWELHTLSESVVELRAYDYDHGYVGLSRADLKPETALALAERFEHAQALLDAGTLSQDQAMDPTAAGSPRPGPRSSSPTTSSASAMAAPTPSSPSSTTCSLRSPAS